MLFSKTALVSFLAIVLLASCAKKREADGCCVFSDLSGTAAPVNDQGRIQVEGSTTAYYAVHGEAGEMVSRRRLNERLDIAPGRYRITVNGASHFIDVEAGRLAKCTTGTLMVTGHAEEKYAVADSASRVLFKESIGKPVSLFPGTYQLSINNTAISVAVTARQVTTARTGSLVVHGTTPELYYVLDNANEQLGYTSLGKSLAFFPGQYVVKVNNTSMDASVFAGGQTQLHTGNIRIAGLTDEYYYVTDSAGNALNYQNLNKSLAVFPGHFVVSVNNTVRRGAVLEQDTAEFVTGSVVLNGRGTGYYYVLDEAGNQLAYNTLNKALSFFPDQYQVKLGATRLEAPVAPGVLTSLSASE